MVYINHFHFEGNTVGKCIYKIFIVKYFVILIQIKKKVDTYNEKNKKQQQKKKQVNNV